MGQRVPSHFPAAASSGLVHQPRHGNLIGVVITHVGVVPQSRPHDTAATDSLAPLYEHFPLFPQSASIQLMHIGNWRPEQMGNTLRLAAREVLNETYNVQAAAPPLGTAVVGKWQQRSNYHLSCKRCFCRVVLHGGLEGIGPHDEM